MKFEHAGKIHVVTIDQRLCAECGTDLEWWVKEKKKKVYWIDNDDMFCSRKCFKEYCLTYWNIIEVTNEKEIQGHGEELNNDNR